MSQTGWKGFDPSLHTTRLPPSPPLSASSIWVAGRLSRCVRVPASHLHNLPARTHLTNMASSWTGTVCEGSSARNPSEFDFMALYDICVTTCHAARISVEHTTSYQNDTLTCCLPTPTTAAKTNICKCQCRRRCGPASTYKVRALTASAPPSAPPIATAILQISPTPQQPPATTESSPLCTPPAKCIRKR